MSFFYCVLSLAVKNFEYHFVSPCIHINNADSIIVQQTESIHVKNIRFENCVFRLTTDVVVERKIKETRKLKIETPVIIQFNKSR